MQAVADKMASKRGRAGTIRSLLADLAVFVQERSAGEDRQTTAEENYVHVLQAMENDEMEPWDVSPTGYISPTGDQDGNPDRGRLTVETASKGLGLAGRVQVPQEMWDRLRPCHWAEAHAGAAEHRASRDVKLAAMIQRVHADGLIDRVQDGRRPNAKAFTKCKSATKGAMIINMVPLNARCAAQAAHAGAPGGHLPGGGKRLEGHVVLQAGRGQHVLVMLDAGGGKEHDPNRSDGRGLGIPQCAVRVDTQPGDSNGAPSEDVSKVQHAGHPACAVRRRHPGIRMVYGFDGGHVKEAGRRLWTLLEEDGWLCSQKSQLEPTTTIDWMGKELDGQAWSMESSAGYVAGMVNMWIKLATVGYC